MNYDNNQQLIKFQKDSNGDYIFEGVLFELNFELYTILYEQEFPFTILLEGSIKNNNSYNIESNSHELLEVDIDMEQQVINGKIKILDTNAGSNVKHWILTDKKIYIDFDFTNCNLKSYLFTK